MSENLAADVAAFLAHKRALGRKYLSEEATLHLLLVYTDQHGVTELAGLTPRLLDEFVASRPRRRARSFNHLIGVLGTFLDWAVSQQLLPASPWHGTRRRETDERLPFLLDSAQVLPSALFDDGGVALIDDGIGGFGGHGDVVVGILPGT